MNNHAIKSGVILGVINIIIILLMYLIDPTLLASLWALVIVVVAFIALVSYFGINNRYEKGGFLSFGKSWIYSIQVMIIAGILGTIFRILLITVIDPELPEIIVEATVANQEAILNRFGVPEEQMEEGLEKAREAAEEQNTPQGMAKGFITVLFIYAVLSLITGAIIKKNEPELEG